MKESNDVNSLNVHGFNQHDSLIIFPGVDTT